MFIPITKNELNQLGWKKLDIILVSGDAYIDSPNIGVALLGKHLIKHGYKVGIISQPDIFNANDISVFGEPELFWGVTGGSVDSMVANYTAQKKFRKQDDFTPGAINNKRPDRAVIKYTNLIRQYYKNTKPIVLGGIEASLRRITHYDFWTNKLRKPILFNAKADFLLYGMAEKSILTLAENLKNKENPKNINGLCYISKNKVDGFISLPSFEQVNNEKTKFLDMFKTFSENCDPINCKGLQQKIDSSRYLIHNPSAHYLNEKELSEIYNLKFTREAHPLYRENVRALETIRFTVPTHRGCYGECNFCAIAIHEGARVRWRSATSIINEVQQMTKHKKWRGNVADLSGPTANMYGYECDIKIQKGKCKHKRCLFPEPCKKLKPNHIHQIKLLESINNIQGVKKVFVASGIRPELVRYDTKHGEKYVEIISKEHVSGQLKLAPESSSEKVLAYMGKHGFRNYLWFKKLYEKFNRKYKKNQFLTYYFIAAHPGCNDTDMKNISHKVFKELKIKPEQVQLFTPTPSTWSTAMYYTETDPFKKKKLFVEKNMKAREKQKKYLQK